MSVGLLLISDGRHEYHSRSYASVIEHLPKFDQYIHVEDPDHTLGFAGAIQHGWSQAETDWLVHWEADFVVDRPVPIDDMITVLHTHPYLVQMALLRGPVNAAERAAGGIIQQHPESYELTEWDGVRWIEHRRFVTTNPCVWPRWVIDRGWPQRSESEGRFGISLFAENPDYRSGFWGDGRVWVDHIGVARAGTGY